MAQPRLAVGERVLWVGAPPRGLIVLRSDLPATLFNLLWMAAVMNIVSGAMARMSPLGGGLVLVMMVSMGAYLTVGRYVADLWRRRSTNYWVTNQRVLIQSGAFHRTTTSMSLQRLPAMVVAEGEDEVGTITFGEVPVRWGPLVVGRYLPGMTRPVQIELVPRVQWLHQTILRAQRASWV